MRRVRYANVESSVRQELSGLMTLDDNRVLIADTTLHDAEQVVRRKMTQDEKLRIANALAALGVDIVEVGQPAASQDDLEFIGALSREIHGPVICGLVRCSREDIAVAERALRDAPLRRIQVVLSAAGTTMWSKSRTLADYQEALRAAVRGVRVARDAFDDVEFSINDVCVSDSEFLAAMAEATIEAGASTVNISDTLGSALPDEFSELCRYVRRNVRGIDRVRLSVRCKDDLGVAVANSLTAVVSGARQVACSVSGIGSKFGNCALEAFVEALQVRQSFFNVSTGIDTSRLDTISRLVSRTLGYHSRGVRWSQKSVVAS